jgi:hypothetical protein
MRDELVCRGIDLQRRLAPRLNSHHLPPAVWPCGLTPRPSLDDLCVQEPPGELDVQRGIGSGVLGAELELGVREAEPAGVDHGARRADDDQPAVDHVRVDSQRPRSDHRLGEVKGDPAELGVKLDPCQSVHSTCADVERYDQGNYVGHDEPSVEFKSNLPGSGNDMTYTTVLPSDPKVQPNASGVGGTTWNFELRPTFWFGLTLCDSQSAPEFTTQCTPDSDSNNLVGTNPNAPDYIGNHPGNAFMELQFYGPGYVPQFEGFGCTATQYCAAMTIDSFVSDQDNGVNNTNACNNYILGGIEPINWAYITTSGVSQAPANPLFTGTFTNPNFTAVNPNTAEDLLMNPGDTIRIHMHDTPAGFRVNA